MFIAHGDRIRKNIRWIMAGILLIIIPSFVALFTTTTGADRRRERDLPTIGGKPVALNAFQDARQAVIQWYILNTGREPRGADLQDRLTQEAVLRMLLLRKAKEFGIRVTSDEVVHAVRAQPILLNEAGQFDFERYRRLVIYLNQIGISEPRYEQLVREQLMRQRLEQMVTVAAVATPLEVEQTYTPLNERVTIELAQFETDFAQPLEVPDEDVQTFYNQNREAFRTPAQVKVRYANFKIEDAKKTIHLTDDEIAAFYERNQPRYIGTNEVAPPLESIKEQVEADLLQLRADREAADRATEFSVRVVARPGAPRPDFVEMCKQAGVEAIETEFFSSWDTPVGETGNVAFVQQAFALGPDAPTSDPVAGPDGYFVLEYLASKPSVVPPLEEVRERVVEQIKRMRLYDATVRQARDSVAQLKKLVADGKTFAEACAELNLTVQSPPAFRVADENLALPAAQRIQLDSLRMPVGAISDLIPTATGGVVFQLKDRQPPDPATAQIDRLEWRHRVLQQNRQALFEAWLQNLIRQENVTFGRPRSRPDDEPAELEFPS